MKRLTQSIRAITLMGFALFSLQACAQPAPYQNVASAYETPGIIALRKPYTRTIFSSENF